MFGREEREGERWRGGGGDSETKEKTLAHTPGRKLQGRNQACGRV